MAKIYISSTYEDLKDHRKNVYGALRAMRHDVISMEDYVAASRPPLDKCLEDVAGCDIYVGLFAWCYGYVPEKDNPKKKSITELEFLAAKEIQQLLFLSRDDHPWPPRLMDAVTGANRAGKRILSLRKRLSQKFLVSFFTSPDDLGKLVTIAVSVAGSQATIGRFHLPGGVADVAAIRKSGSTQTPEVVDKIRKAMAGTEGARIIEVDLAGGKAWWSTRLFLLAALADEYSAVEQILFVRGNTFLGMAPPATVRKALVAKDSRLEVAFQNSVAGPAAAGRGAREKAVIQTIQAFGEHWAAPDIHPERKPKVWVTWRRLKPALGSDLSTDAVKILQKDRGNIKSLFSKVIQQEEHLVPVIQAGKPIRVLDRTELASDLASSALKVF